MTDTQRGERSASVREIEFEISESAYPFVSASNRLDCRIDLAEMLPRGDGEYAEFFTVTDGEPERIADIARTHESVDTRLLSGGESGAFLEFRVSEACPAVTLAELGALPQVVRAEGGTGRIVAEVPSQCDAVAITDSFIDRVPEADFTAKREINSLTTPFSQTGFRRELRARLTERQREVLEAALEAGYYEWPRDCSGEAVAAELGITSPTFSEHIHAAERKLLTMVFEESRSRDET
ncbi:helix-turn-helix domain-containing protein [Natrinema salsiterrestre]|uniref:Helix-turn-helix domain-containing protein n=1 Tax=Natrinema salsiterrestre TaxID=2950540 RepID=A0A9Q4PZD5_9EURY|nr:helix-turn-helix domain-containing protein [Natrinema salsiterrestre]MDF9744014.1 helix-turn-helix domain-containing protein [Natrinema salsiterrestre]